MSNNFDRAEKACYDRLKPKTKGLKFEEALQAMREGKICWCKESDSTYAIIKVQVDKNKWKEELSSQDIEGRFEDEEPLYLYEILSDWEIVDD